MKKLLVGVAAVPFLASVAMAGQPMALNDAQMDKVVAGGGIEIETANVELHIYTGVSPQFSFSLELGGNDVTGHTFCQGQCTANAISEAAPTAPQVAAFGLEANAAGTGPLGAVHGTGTNVP
jgi:hypothetical protein